MFDFVKKDTKGISCSTVVNPKIQNVSVKNCGYAGIWLNLCVGGTIEKNLIENIIYDGCKTGYGIQTYGCIDTIINNNTINYARRGIDISGTIPSRNILVESNEVSVTSDPDYSASCIGTHGSAENIVFRNNVTSGGLVSVLIRGSEIRVENNKLLNAEYVGVLIQTGINHYLINNEICGRRMNGSFVNEGIQYCLSDETSRLHVIGNRICAKVCIQFGTDNSTAYITENIINCRDCFIKIRKGVHIKPLQFDDNVFEGSSYIIGDFAYH